MKKSLLLIPALAVCSLMTFVNGNATTTESSDLLLLPVTSARQIVDGGKYIIAAYNHNWGTEDHADKRFLKFENNKNKFVTATDATAESTVWTANTIEAACSSTGHGYSATVTLSQNGQYIKQHTTRTNNAENATTSTNTDPCNIFEFFTVATPQNGVAEYTYFSINYNYDNGMFEKGMWVSNTNLMGIGSQTGNNISTAYYNSGNQKWTTYFRVWHVIATEGDLAKHAKGYKEERLADPAVGNGVGHLTLTFSDDLETMISKENSNEAVTQDNLDEFTAAAAATQATPNMPATGTYLKFTGSSSEDIRRQAVLYHTTACGANSSGVSNNKMTVDNRHPDGGYSEEKAIMYYDGEHLLSYSTGYYLGLKDGWLAFKSSADMAEGQGGNQPATIGIAPGTTANRASYQINFNNGSTDNTRNISGLHINGKNSSWWYGDRCGSSSLNNTMHDAHDWVVAQVNELPVTLAEDGYGSFFAPVAVSFAEGVTVYAASITGESITFNEVDAGTPIAPNTPVVLKGDANTTVNAAIDYSYSATTPAIVTASTDNITFTGKNVVEKLTAAEGVQTFSLASGSNESNSVIMTKVEVGACVPVNTMLVTLPDDCPLISENGTVTLSLNESNPTTGLREIEAAQSAAADIYDLQGRRLAAPIRGLNIINGRKVLVK